MDVLEVIWHGLRDSFLMAWEVWWALVFGFFISASCRRGCRASASRTRSRGSGPKPVALATGLGAASSSCSYAAIAIAKSLFQKGASATPRRWPSSSPRPTSCGSWASCCGC